MKISDLLREKILTQLVSLQAYSCVECGRCMEHCPANNTGKLLNPKEIVLGLRGYLNEYGPASEEPLLGKYNSQEAVFRVHHLRRVRVSVPGGDRACADHRRAAARRGEHGRMGRRSRGEACFWRWSAAAMRWA